MPKLDALTRDTDSVAIPFGSDTLTVQYRPGALTTELVEALQGAETATAPAAAVLEPLARLLVSWDLLDDDERPIPTTVQGLRGVPLSILARVAEAVASALAQPVTAARIEAAGPRARRN